MNPKFVMDTKMEKKGPSQREDHAEVGTKCHNCGIDLSLNQ